MWRSCSATAADTATATEVRREAAPSFVAKRRHPAPRSGAILFKGTDVRGKPPYAIAKADGTLDLFICNDDSLGERIQAEFPATKVVKTLNTTNTYLMSDPGQLGGGDHTIFVSGNDADAKARVAAWLREWFGWMDIIDLGDITTARGTEMLLPLWVRLMTALGTAEFNFKVVR